MTQDACLRLYDAKMKGVFSGGLNLRFLPQGSNMVKNQMMLRF